jgi:hypothetical protein
MGLLWADAYALVAYPALDSFVFTLSFQLPHVMKGLPLAYFLF